MTTVTKESGTLGYILEDKYPRVSYIGPQGTIVVPQGPIQRTAGEIQRVWAIGNINCCVFHENSPIACARVNFELFWLDPACLMIQVEYENM